MEKTRQSAFMKLPSAASLLSKGHRQRLKERFMQSPLRKCPDYEILEMMLFYVIPRSDTKTLAKNLIHQFGSLAGVINADANDICKIKGAGESTTLLFKLLLDFNSRLFLTNGKNQKKLNIFSNWHSVLNYCRLTMGYQKKSEFFRVLYLNKKNHLIADEFHENGTIDRIAVYPREIARKLINVGASAIILVHNHPSGDPKPSNEDLEITRHIAKVLEPLNAKIHDHLIVSGFDHFSFRYNNLL